MTTSSDTGPATPIRAEAALAKHGFDGHKLLAYAHTIARREMQRAGSTLGDRHEDLVMFLVETGCRTAVRYNPDKTSQTYEFSSYLYDVMAQRVPDFYRRKAEGFGDRRKNHDDRVISLVDADPADINEDSLEKLFTADRLAGWTAAAKHVDWPLEEWITLTLDRAARDLLEAAA